MTTELDDNFLADEAPLTPEGRPDEVTIYRDRAGKWRWRRVDGYNKTDIVSDSGQGYASIDFCEHMANKVNAQPFSFRFVA